MESLQEWRVKSQASQQFLDVWIEVCQAHQLELCAILAFTLGMRDDFCPGAGRFWAAVRLGRTFSSANTSCSSDCASAARTDQL